MNYMRKWQPTPVFLPGKYHGQRSLVGYSPLDHKESDTTEQLSTHIGYVFTRWQGKNYNWMVSYLKRQRSNERTSKQNYNVNKHVPMRVSMRNVTMSNLPLSGSQVWRKWKEISKVTSDWLFPIIPASF